MFLIDNIIVCHTSIIITIQNTYYNKHTNVNDSFFYDETLNVNLHVL